MPQSDGYYKQWIPKSGSIHYTMVDESSCNGTTDYNYTTTSGKRDSYGVNISSIPDGAAIKATYLLPCASKNKSNGSSYLKTFYRFNGTDGSDSSSYTLSGTTPINLATTTFNSLSLIKDSSSTLEIGALLYSGTAGARLGRLSVVVEYNTLNAPSNLSANSSSTTIYLSWTDNSSYESGFKIERGTDGVNFLEIDSVSANITGYTDETLSPGIYYYRVRAYKGSQYSDYSNIESVVVD